MNKKSLIAAILAQVLAVAPSPAPATGLLHSVPDDFEPLTGKQRMALRMADLDAARVAKAEKARGYCAKHYLLMTTAGRCPLCEGTESIQGRW